MPPVGEKIIVRELLELMDAKTESGGNIELSGGMRIKRERENVFTGNWLILYYKLVWILLMITL